MNASPSERMQERLDEPISRAVQEVEGGFILKWVAIIESASPEGDRGLWTIASPGTKSYETLGMMAFATQLEQAATVRDMLNG